MEHAIHIVRMMNISKYIKFNIIKIFLKGVLNVFYFYLIIYIYFFKNEALIYVKHVLILLIIVQFVIKIAGINI